MKVKILAVALLILIAGAVALNTVFLGKRIEHVAETVHALHFEGSPDEAYEDAKQSFEDFKHEEKYLSLTVNHNDLTDIEGLFSEMIGYLSIEDTDNAKVTKSRLIDALSHLGRLSAINMSSIF